MKLSLLISIFLSVSLFANTEYEICKNDLQSMYKHNFNAQDLFLENQLDDARNQFHMSIEFANKALTNCENFSKIDFNYMYNYIIYSENEISKIDNIKAYKE